jgi:hypothetical protein
MITLLLLVPLAQAFVSLSTTGQNTYGMAFYLVNYHFGFIKRGLFGQLFAGMPFVSASALAKVALANTAICILVIYAVFSAPFSRTIGKAALFSFLLSGPAMLPHLAYHSGFLDNPLLILLVLAMFILRWSGTWIAVAVITLLCILGLLIHEAFLLMFYPLVLLLMIIRCKERRLRSVVLAAHLLIIAAAFLVIEVRGKLAISADSYLNYLQSRTDLYIPPDFVRVWNLPISRMPATILHSMPLRLLAGTLIALLTSIPYFCALKTCVALTIRAPGTRQLTLPLTTATLCMPLLLVFVATDVMRWVSAACINVSLYVLWIEWNRAPSGSSDESAGPVSFTKSPWFTAYFACSLVIGAFGIYGNRFTGKLVSLIPAFRAQ